MYSVGEPEFEYANNNASAFFQARKSLGNTTKATVNRFNDPSGLKALGKNFIGYSMVVDKDGNIIDYDKDTFVSESDADLWLNVMKQSDFHTKRQGLVIPVEDEAEVETGIINRINSGNPDESSEHEGSLPDSYGNKDYSGPYWTESERQKARIEQKKMMLELDLVDSDKHI